jgi:hypothetical protein
LEILTGKRPTDPMLCSGLTIVDSVATRYQDDMLRVLDAHPQAECLEFSRLNVEEENRVYRCLLSLIKVGLSCAQSELRIQSNLNKKGYDIFCTQCERLLPVRAIVKSLLCPLNLWQFHKLVR